MEKHNHKEVDVRLATIEGHIKGIRQMITEDKSCEEILMQLKAVKNSVDKLTKLVLLNHASTCVKNAVDNQDIEEYDKFVDILSKYVNG